MPFRPTAIIFDYGNVLSLPQSQAEADALAASLETSSRRFHEVYWRFRRAYDEAALGPDAYWREVARALSRDLTSPLLEKLLHLDARSWIHPSPGMPEWAEEVRRAGLRIGLLSNMPGPIRDAVLTAGWLPEFDDATFSCDVFETKPAPPIYEHCLRGLGIEAWEALFLDDRPENVEAARSLGMHAVVFTTAAEVAIELERGFDLPSALISKLKAAG